PRSPRPPAPPAIRSVSSAPAARSSGYRWWYTAPEAAVPGRARRAAERFTSWATTRGRAAPSLAQQRIQRVEPDEHLAWLRAVRWAEHARVVELVDDPRRTAVADAQPPLEQRRR